jgi:hypothetical protein
MGWYCGRETKRKLVEKLKARAQHHRLVGNHLWTVEDCHGQPTICLYLIEVEMGRAWYKDLSEAMHPYYYDCPESLLALAPETNHEWRAKVREYHEKRRAARSRKASLMIGDVIQLPEGYVPNCFEIVSTKPLLGRAKGGTFKLRAQHIADMTLVRKSFDF